MPRRSTRFLHAAHCSSSATSARPPSVRCRTRDPSVVGWRVVARAHHTPVDTAQTGDAARPPAYPPGHAPIPASRDQRPAQKPPAVAHDRLAMNPVWNRTGARRRAHRRSARTDIDAPRRARRCPVARQRSPVRPRVPQTQTLRSWSRMPLHIRWRPAGPQCHGRRRSAIAKSYGGTYLAMFRESNRNASVAASTSD